MIHRLRGIERDKMLDIEKSDALIKLQIGNEVINLPYKEICDLSNLLNDAKNSIFEDACLDLEQTI